jgi:hypothetical protein
MADKKKTVIKWFTSTEISLHNAAEDCWVSFLGKVYNLTPLIAAHNGTSPKQITNDQMKRSYVPLFPLQEKTSRIGSMARLARCGATTAD